MLTQNETGGQYIDHLLEKNEAFAHFSKKDKSLLLEIVYGVLRNRTYLDLILQHYIKKGYRSFPVVLKQILRTAIYQLAFLQRVPAYAAVSEAVEIARSKLDSRRAAFVNAVLRNYERERWQPDPPDPHHLEQVADYYSHPLWLVKLFADQFGQQELIPWLQANNRVPEITVRLLAADASVPQTLAPLPGFSGYFRLQPGTDLEALELWKEGKLIVQDASAGLAVDLVRAEAGERIIDLCAAPGGKTMILARQVGPEGVVEAVERSPARCHKIRQNLRRLQLTNVVVECADARQYGGQPADAVLVDAPCSGLGVLARRADLRWKRKPEDIPELVRLQLEILEQAAALVRPGGRLVYSTCTINREENEEILERFLQRHQSFRVTPAETLGIDAAFITPEGFVRTFPHRHHVDGTFAVRLEKK